MHMLITATLKHGLIPLIVPEFPGITVGGAFAGTAGESTSFRWGFFDRMITWVEMVLADGRVVRATADGENEDLFLGAVGAMGTLGVGTCFEIQLQQAREFVELTYVPVVSAVKAIERFEEMRGKEEGVDFVDGIMFANDRGVVVVGRLSDGRAENMEKELDVVRFTRRVDPWFYLHAESQSMGGGEPKNLVPIYDYLFRYDRGAFWMGSYSFVQWWNPFNRLTRWIWDPIMRTRTLYKMMHAKGSSQRLMIQDIAVPKENAVTLLEYVDKELGIWPVWLCPIRGDSQAPMHSFNPREEKDKEGLLINVGIWGLGSEDFVEFVETNRELEKKVQELGGKKWLYGHMYYTEDEFWQIYNKEIYDGLRKQWNAALLPNIYSKAKSTEVQQKEKRLWRVLLGIFGNDYLLMKT